MGTDKRERQKANRQQRLDELVKQQQRDKTRKRAIQIGAVIAVAVIATLLFAIFGSNDDDTVTTDTTVAADVTSVPGDDEQPVTTQAPDTTAVPADAITGETPCPDETAKRTITFAQAPPSDCTDPTKTYTAQFKIKLNGEAKDLTVELDAAAAPITVNNFVVLARYHYFDGTVCHRAVTDFVVQCGDPTATGGGGPGYEFEDELPASLDEYVLGSVAMANSGPNTNGSQFFFVTSPVAGPKFGSPNYSVFGQVSEGLDTTLSAMASFATPTEAPSGLIQIESVTITES